MYEDLPRLKLDFFRMSVISIASYINNASSHMLYDVSSRDHSSLLQEHMHLGDCAIVIIGGEFVFLPSDTLHSM